MMMRYDGKTNKVIQIIILKIKKQSINLLLLTILLFLVSRDPLHRGSIIIGLNKRHKSPILISRDIICWGSSDCPCNWPCNRSCSQINTNINCLPLSKTSALSLAGWIFLAYVDPPGIITHCMWCAIDISNISFTFLSVYDTDNHVTRIWVRKNFYLKIEDLIVKDYFIE